MQTLAQIKSLLASHGLAPRHTLGQNFLIDHNLLAKLVESASLCAGELILEVGPGTGTLTQILLERGCRVIACELDEGLADLLKDTLSSDFPETFTLIRGDCLASKHELHDAIVQHIAGQPYKLVANLPYQVATPLILTLLLAHPNCRSLHVTIQQEVAQRIVASPGSKIYGELSVLAQALSMPRKIATLPPGCFWPQPKVTSAMLVLERRDVPMVDDPQQLVVMTRRLFATRRKQLGTILGRDHPLPEGVQTTQRPESLSVEQICWLANLASA